MSALPYVALAFCIVCWSFGPPLAKHITSAPQLTAWLRMAIGAGINLVLLGVTGRRPSVARLKQTMLPGILLGANFGTLLAALHHASVASVAVITSMQPVAVLFLAGPLFGERIRLWHVAWTAVGLGGAAVVVLGADSTIRMDGAGIVLAVLSLFSFTGFFLLSKQRAVTMPPLEYMGGAMLSGTIALTPTTLLAVSPRAVAHISARDWVFVLLFTLIPGLAHLVMSWCHEYVPVSVSSLAMLVQPAGAAFLAWPIQHEPVTILQGLGGVIVLGSIAAVVRRPTVPRAVVESAVDPLPA